MAALGEMPRSRPLAARARPRERLAGGLWPTALLALVVRGLVVLTSPNFRPLTDAADFNRLAVDLATTGSFGPSIVTQHGGATAMRPPVFSVLLSLVYRVLGFHYGAARLLEALLGAVAVALLWLIAARLWDRRVAHLAAGLAAVYPPLIMVGSSLLSEAVFIPALLATVLCGLIAGDAAADPGRGRAALGWSALCGALLGLTALSRSNGVVIGLPLLFLVWRGRPRLGPASLRAPLVLVLACALVLSPWALRNQEVLGTPVPTTTETGYALAGIYNATEFAHPRWHGFWGLPVAQVAQINLAHPGLNEAQIGGRLTHEAVSYAWAHPGRVAYEAWWNLRRLLNLSGYEFEYVQGILEGYPISLVRASMIAFWLIGLLALGGIVVLACERRSGSRGAPDPQAGSSGADRRSARRVPAAFWWCPAILFLTLVPIIGNSRYRSPVDPFLLLLAAVAVRSILDARRVGRDRTGARGPRIDGLASPAR